MPSSRGSATVKAQKTSGTGAFVDPQHALDPVYVRKLGVDVENLLIGLPDRAPAACRSRPMKTS